jgi:hypothetical protein
MSRKPQTHTNAAGWERIAKVEVEIYRDGHGEVVDAYVFVATTAGEVFARTINKGELPAQVADHYRARGWTDADCCCFGPAA